MLTITAATYIISQGIVENMKMEALKIAELYEGSIKIEINTSKGQELAKVNITEYNL